VRLCPIRLPAPEGHPLFFLERVTGFEPAMASLGSWTRRTPAAGLRNNTVSISDLSERRPLCHLSHRVPNLTPKRAAGGQNPDGPGPVWPGSSRATAAPKPECEGLRREPQPTSGQSLLTKQGQRELEALPLSPIPSTIRQDCLTVLHLLDEHIRRLDRELVLRWGNDPRVRRLLTIPGIGPFTAILVVLELGDVHRFPSAKHVASSKPTSRARIPRVQTSRLSPVARVERQKHWWPQEAREAGLIPTARGDAEMRRTMRKAQRLPMVNEAAFYGGASDSPR